MTHTDDARLAEIARIIKRDCHAYIQSEEGKCVDYSNIAVLGVYGVEEAARAIASLQAREQKPVGWFNPWNDYHGYQQVAKEYEGSPETIPLYAAPQPDKYRAALRLALPLLERDYRSLLECCSLLDDKLEPIVGTLEDDAKEDAAAYDTAIKAIRDVIGEDGK